MQQKKIQQKTSSLLEHRLFALTRPYNVIYFKALLLRSRSLFSDGKKIVRVQTHKIFASLCICYTISLQCWGWSHNEKFWHAI